MKEIYKLIGPHEDVSFCEYNPPTTIPPYFEKVYNIFSFEHICRLFKEDFPFKKNKDYHHYLSLYINTYNTFGWPSIKLRKVMKEKCW